MPAHPQQPADDTEDIRRGPAPGVVDEMVANNLRRHREKLGLSQADLSAKMTALGWRYHPQTVHKNEAGQRKVPIGEAAALARIFGTTLDRLTWLQGEDAVVAATEDAIARIRQAWQEVSTAVLGLGLALAAGRRVLDEARATRYKRARDTADFLEAEIAHGSIESATEDGLSRMERFRSGEGDVGSC